MILAPTVYHYLTFALTANWSQTSCQQHTPDSMPQAPPCGTQLTKRERSMTSRILFTITSSTWRSHFSTAPLASVVEMTSLNSTFSPSLLNIECMSSLSSNPRLPMPSKHFLRWGWTRSGSFVSDRISSISSLDRKKNLQWYIIVTSPTGHKLKVVTMPAPN